MCTKIKLAKKGWEDSERRNITATATAAARCTGRRCCRRRSVMHISCNFFAQRLFLLHMQFSGAPPPRWRRRVGKLPPPQSPCNQNPRSQEMCVFKIKKIREEVHHVCSTTKRWQVGKNDSSVKRMLLIPKCKLLYKLKCFKILIIFKFKRSKLGGNSFWGKTQMISRNSIPRKLSFTVNKGQNG